MYKLILIGLLYSIQSFSISFTESSINNLNVRYLEVADLDNDGWNDIVVLLTDGSAVYWYKNNKNGDFSQNIVTNKIGIGARAAKVADLDKDGYVDIVITSDKDNSIYWFKNQGQGVFTETTISNNTSNANSLFISDIDNDGDSDLLVTTLDFDFFTNATRSKVYLFENNGANSFLSPITILDSNNSVLNAISANISSSNSQDLIIANTDSDSIRRFIPSFSETTEVDTGLDGVNGLFAIDLDNDGDTDILSASQLDNSVRWHNNQGSSFSTQLIDEEANGAIDVHSGDVDLDGDNDIVVAALTGGAIYFYENTGQNLFRISSFRNNTISVSSVRFSDLNNDGSLDIVSASASGLSWFKNDFSDILFKSSFEQ